MYLVKHFDKPLYTYEGKYKIFLDQRFIDKAKRRKRKIKLVVTDVGEGIYSPAEWLRNSEYMEKVYKYPDNPMKLWGNYFEAGHGIKSEPPKPDFGITDNVRSRLLTEWRTKYA